MPRRSREELERKRAEERAQQQAEAERLVEEKRRREEEEQRQAEEERAQAMREAALLQKQVGSANICSANTRLNLTALFRWMLLIFLYFHSKQLNMLMHPCFFVSCGV